MQPICIQKGFLIEQKMMLAIVDKKLHDPSHRRGGRAAEGARLESVYTLIAYRGFESLSLRHYCLGMFNSLSLFVGA